MVSMCATTPATLTRRSITSAEPSSNFPVHGAGVPIGRNVRARSSRALETATPIALAQRDLRDEAAIYVALPSPETAKVMANRDIVTAGGSSSTAWRSRCNRQRRRNTLDGSQ